MQASVAGVIIDPRHWIGGRRYHPTPPITGELPTSTFADFSPIDERLLASVSRGKEPEVNQAVAAAAKAFPGWAATSAADRAALLHAIADGIDARIEDLAQVETADNGALLRSHRRSVMPRVAHNFRFFADWLGKLDGGGLEINGHREQVSWAPAGVTAVITPWNAPLMLATWRIAPALAAGNTVVLKPAEWAPLTASLLADITKAAGLPDGVFNVVQGLGAEAGAALAGHQGIARLAFTGSVRTGRLVAAAAGAQLTPVSLELGGKSPLLVFADADLDLAVRQAVGQYDNAGQVCLAGTRLCVEESIAAEFTERFIEAADRAPARRPARGDDRHRPEHHPGPRRAGRRLRPASDRNWGSGTAGRRCQPRTGRPLLPADAAGQRDSRAGDPDRGSVRPGAHAADLHQRAGGGGAGQQHQVRAGRDIVHRR